MLNFLRKFFKFVKHIFTHMDHTTGKPESLEQTSLEQTSLEQTSLEQTSLEEEESKEEKTKKKVEAFADMLNKKKQKEFEDKYKAPEKKEEEGLGGAFDGKPPYGVFKGKLPSAVVPIGSTTKHHPYNKGIGIPLGDMQGPTKPPAKKLKKKKKKKAVKLVSLFIIGFTVTLCSGCSKNQDVKIVHNYWDKVPSYAERKQEMHMDLYVCKNYKASDKGKTAVVYKVN